MKPSLIVICGTTATGKSAIALTVAQKLNTIIISADSRQVYREFDIGTAKPTIEERSQIPHYLIDICAPTETLTLAQYQERARAIINASKSPIPWLLVGGTGLYLKSIVRGLKIPRVSPQSELRSQLHSLGQPYCYALLTQVDPIAASKIHARDEVRTKRALEVFYVTGYPISQQQGENPPDYPILQVGLTCQGEPLRQRIKQRTEQMLALGWVEEVEQLTEKYGWNLSLLATLGYAEIKQFLVGKMSLAEATEAIILRTAQFAKRQRTWFRADPKIEWFDVTQSDVEEQVWQRVTEFLKTEQSC